MFSRLMQQQHMKSSEVNLALLTVYKVNYQLSLLNCHQLMMSAFLSFLLVLETTG
jgi:hypothetical protein